MIADRKKAHESSSNTSYTSSTSMSESLDGEDQAERKIEKLTLELRCQEDLCSHTNRLKERIDSCRRNVCLAVATMNERMEAIESLWDKEILIEQSKMSDELRKLAERIDERKQNGRSTLTSYRSTSTTATTTSNSGTETPIHILSPEPIIERSRNMSEQVEQIEKKLKGLANISRNLYENQLNDDRRRLTNLNAKKDEVALIEKQLTEQLGKMQGAGEDGYSLYGTCEMIDNYRSSIVALSQAIHSLEQISRIPAMASSDPLTKKEIENINGSMKNFLFRLRTQIVPAKARSLRRVSTPKLNTKKTHSAPSSTASTPLKDTYSWPPPESNSESAESVIGDEEK